MKITIKQLNHYLKHDLTSPQLCEALVSAGLEVEEIIDFRASLASFVVGKIVESEKHPNADKLKICNVDIGQENLIQIICGASNARTGLYSVVAQIGTIIPSTQNIIKKGKIRGIESQGMLCSYEELGIKNEYCVEGIIELDQSINPGTALLDVLDDIDTIIHLSVTPNRGDCLSVYGIARDLAANNHGTLIEINPNDECEIEKKIQSLLSIKNDTILNDDGTNYVTSYYAKEISNIQTMISPKWLVDYLKNIDQQSVNFSVDLTNFIMHNIGQPMHVFDRKKIVGSISVKISKEGQGFEALNGQYYTLPSGCIIICDEKGIIALAGIIGAKHCSVDEHTTHVLVECAVFDPVLISKAGQALNIPTQSRLRFERGVDEKITKHALEKFIHLLASHQSSPIAVSSLLGWNVPTIDYSIVFVSLDYIQKITGDFSITSEEVSNVFKKIGCTILNEKKSQSDFQIQIPSFRHDIKYPCDLAEEVLRLIGYNHIKSKSLPLEKRNLIANNSLEIKKNINFIASSLGYQETLTWSFINTHQLEQTNEQTQNILEISNPLTQDFAYMRPMLLPSLLSICNKNYRESKKSGRFFEIASVYGKQYELCQQQRFACISFGHRQRCHWHEKERFIDFFDLKADLETILNMLNITYRIEPFLSHPLFHPKQAINVLQGNMIIAHAGMIHPKWLEPGNTAGGIEIIISNLLGTRKRKKFSGITYPSIERDLAFVVNEDIKVGSIVEQIKKNTTLPIQDIEVFDIYRGENLEKNQYSVAMRIIIQSPNRTLTEEEITSWRSAIVDMLKNKMGIFLRK
jgi:phenylalanyl-tRNA synthetase beta chain